MTARLAPVVLTGRHVRLEPLGRRHLADLAAAGLNAAIWTWMPLRPAGETDLATWIAEAEEAAEAGRELAFATVDLVTGRAVGSSRFLNVALEHRRVEIGWTWIAPAWQGTAVNSEAKLLMLDHAFGALGCRRVEFKTHAANGRSRTALLAIGATFEGILRKHMVMPDGSARDSAYFAILDDDWPAIRERLEARIERLASARPASMAADASMAAVSPPATAGTIETADYHTAGEPFRIVTAGVPPLAGSTVLERRRFAASHLDEVRRLLIHEPRGHADMYGAHVVPPNDPDADLGVVFFHNEGYSTACGHGTIALVTWAIDSGRIAAREPETPVTVDVPSGRLACVARIRNGRVEAVRFRNVPAYVEASGVEVATSRGPIVADVAFGGAFYGSVEVGALGLAVTPSDLPALIALQRELRPALDAAVGPVHPDEPEIRGIYGIIFWQAEAIDGDAATDGDGGHSAIDGGRPAVVQRNVTVFADGEVDRSPCGSGTSARLALLAAAGEIRSGEILVHRSIVDSVFRGRVVAAGPAVGGRPTVITEVEGSAFATGRSVFRLDPRDPLGTGFLLR